MTPSLARVRRTLPRLGAALPFVALLAPGARANEVVVMKSGSRLEVVRAYESGDSLHCQLPGDAGNVVIARASVKRVSSASTDIPESRGTLVASASGGGAGSGSPSAVSSERAARVAAEEAASAYATVASLGVQNGGDFTRSPGYAARRSELAHQGADNVLALPGSPSPQAGSARPTAEQTLARRQAERIAMQQSVKPTPQNLRSMLSRVGGRSAPSLSTSAAPSRPSAGSLAASVQVR
jgi:hypothetical protein